MTFTIKLGDTSPSLEAELVDEDGTSAALSLADDVIFYMEDQDNQNVIQSGLDDNVSIINESEGKVQYSWKKGDTDVSGYKNAEFEVVFTNGEVKTYPNSSFIEVYVKPDVADKE